MVFRICYVLFAYSTEIEFTGKDGHGDIVEVDLQSFDKIDNQLVFVSCVSHKFDIRGIPQRKSVSIVGMDQTARSDR